MPGNVPNVSRDSFQFAKMYDGVVLQQGVPIPDSDWNELDDIRRIMSILEGIYFWGENLLFAPVGAGSLPGFYPLGTGATNDFTLSAGVALVGGVLVPTTLDEPPALITYDDASQRNFIVNNGVVESFGAGVLTESTKNWQAFHDLLATANHGACRVRFTSGTESGNEYTITAYTATTLTLSGGSPSTGDTYMVLPPELTTPGGARTDEVYLMVWWEDTAAEEDTSIEHPGLGVETAHRLQRRWCVRVTENGSTPSTPSNHGFGVRYLQIGTLNRTASATISVGEVVGELALIGRTYADHLAQGGAHGFTGNYTAAAVAAGNNGGLGTGIADIDAAFQATDDAVIRRRAFTATITGGAYSSGGDYEGASAIDNLESFADDGTFFLRRGLYTWSTATSLTKDVSVVGELLGEASDPCKMNVPVGASADFSLKGKFSQLQLGTNHASYLYDVAVGDHLRLEDVEVDGGALKVTGGHIDWLRGKLISASGPTANSGLYMTDTGTTDPPHGVFEDVHFNGPGPSASSPTAAVHIDSVKANPATDQEGLTFKNCLFEATSGAQAVRLSDVETPVLFENCVFIGGGAGAEAFWGGGSDRVTCINCQFYNSGGRTFRFGGAGTFINCHIYDGGPAHNEPVFSCRSEDSEKGLYFFSSSVRLDGGCHGATILPCVEFGAVDNSITCLNLVVDGFMVMNKATYASRYSMVAMHGSSSLYGKASYSNILVNQNAKQAQADRSTYGVMGRSAIVEVAGVVSSNRPPVMVENLSILNLEDPNAAAVDDGSMFVARNAIIRGLILDATSSPSGTGTTGAVDGLIKLIQDVTLYDLQLFQTQYNEMAAGGSVRAIQLGQDCHLRGGTLWQWPSPAIDSLIALLGDRAGVHGVKLFDTNAHSTTPIHNNPSGIDTVFENNQLELGARGATLLQPGVQSRTNGNTIKATSITNPVINAGANARVLMTGNVLLNAAATVPTITATGTGAVVGADNVLAANAT